MQDFFQNDSANLFFQRIGKGEPLIMIHGACVDSDFFADTAKILARWYTVYIYDRRGYGRSTDCEESTVALQVTDLAALIRQIGTPCHIAAHSAGTIIAMGLIEQYPQLVRNVLLHEPLDAGSLPAECAVSETFRKIVCKIRAGKINSAMAQFLPLIGERDPRARDVRPEELLHTDRNRRQFMMFEADEFFRYCAPIDAISRSNITIGIGELSKDTFRWTVSTELARKSGASLLYFPGGHNCAYDLPNEFAYLTAGAIAD